MKALVIYYSFTENTKFIAEKIAKAVNADLLPLEVEENFTSKGFMKFLWGGKQVLMREQPKLLPLSKNLEDYDIIFIGTPVWAWTFVPALRSFFANVKFKNKKIALFCCHGGGKGKVFQKMQQHLKGNKMIGQIDFREPLKSCAQEKGIIASDWAEKLFNLK